MKWRFSLSVPILASFMMDAHAWAALPGVHVEVKLTQSMRENCHIVRFPRGWVMQRFDDHGAPLSFDYRSEYEFRADGFSSTRFMVGGFQTWVGRRYDTTTRYKVDFSDPSAPILPASRAAWESGTVVPQTRKSIFPPGETMPNDRRADFHGYQFLRSGDFWAQPSGYATRLPPDQAWLVLQSTTGTRQDVPTRIFLDVFNADTGRKILTIGGACSGFTNDPDGALSMTAWVTERYFIVPLGEHKERCLVCDFAARRPQQGAKP
jgi:hypothetical protein